MEHPSKACLSRSPAAASGPYPRPASPTADSAVRSEEDYRRLSARAKPRSLVSWRAGRIRRRGLGTFSMCVVLEEMAQHRMGLYNPAAVSLAPRRSSTGYTQEIEVAVPTIRDSLHTFFAITEPSGGSDPPSDRAPSVTAARGCERFEDFHLPRPRGGWGVVFAAQTAVAASAASSSRRERRA